MASLSSVVLVVDDEPQVLQLMELMLRRHHLAVETASSASGAIKKMLDQSFGALVVDKNLPDKSGLEVIAEARRLHPYCACIMMTGFPSYDSILAAMRIGAVDYLEKPFTDVNLVAQKIARAVEQQQIVFERDTFARLVREMRGEMRKREQLLMRQQSDIELLRELIDTKVAERTSELTRRLQSAEEELRALKTPLA